MRDEKDKKNVWKKFSSSTGNSIQNSIEILCWSAIWTLQKVFYLPSALSETEFVLFNTHSNL